MPLVLIVLLSALAGMLAWYLILLTGPAGLIGVAVILALAALKGCDILR
jgi:hypothetical protein